MTELEERTLKFYLRRVGRIATDEDFEEWYRHRHDDADSEALYKEALDRAQAFAGGYQQGWAEFRLQVSVALKAKPDIPQPEWSAAIPD